MPRYFFHVHDGQAILDEDGTELRDLRAARQEAVWFAGALLRDDHGRFWNREGWKVEVSDHDHLLLFTLHVLAVSAPVSAPRQD